MLRFAADENFDNRIVSGLHRRNRNIDLVRVQDVGLYGADDPIILDWAAREGRILVTHDLATVSPYAYERIGKGLPMPGVFAISARLSIVRAIEELLLIAECSREGEWEGQVRYLPL
jgi:hypothetical protein